MLSKDDGRIARLVGARIRELRIERGLSQGELETESLVSRSIICEIESGAHCPSLSTIWKLGRALGVDPNIDIVGVVDEDAARA